MAKLVEACSITEFDHVVLGTRDTKEGSAWLANLTGVTPHITTPEPGQWYHSAVLPLKDGALIEILGPNPDHHGFHPIKAMLAPLVTPELIFWHLGTSDFEALCAATQKVGAPVERIEHLDNDGPQGRRAYTRGIIGPGFRSTRPCVIQWKARPERGASVCRAADFRIQDPNPDALNRVFETLDLRLRARPGTQALQLDLETPNGPVTLTGGHLRLEGVGFLVQLIRLWLGHVTRRTR